MIQRTLNPKFLTEVVNHSEVLPWVSEVGPLNIEAVVRDPANYCLVTEHGGFIFYRYEPCVYEVHTQFLPSAPTTHVVRAAREAQHWMCTRTDAIECYTKAAVDNERAIKLIEFTRWNFRFSTGKWNDSFLKHFVTRYDDWTLYDDSLEAAGHKFHEELKAKFAEPDHKPDRTHDRYVGACVETIRGGQPEKALAFYNRWARSTGYAQIQGVSKSPLIIDIKSCKLHIRDNDFEVL